jgi:aryl-alcohol dehydrogenase-like predicted oxidoreductase
VERRAIGSLEVTVVGVGCNNFGSRLDEAATAGVVHGAIDAGVTFFDTANTYGGTQSEVLLGKAIAGRRDEVVVASKFGMPLPDGSAGAAPDYVRRACEDSLRRLGTDRIDLYQLHAPDPSVPIADTLGALAALRDEGKVREVGCSNFSADQLHEAARAGAAAGIAFASVQNQYSLLWRTPERDGVLAACDELGMAFLPYYPLANGLLTGKVPPGSAPPAGSRLATMPTERQQLWLSSQFTDTVGSLLDYAASRSVPLLTLAMSWLLDHQAVASVIAGATSADQVRANAAAAASLPEGARAALDELTDRELRLP